MIVAVVRVFMSIRRMRVRSWLFTHRLADPTLRRTVLHLPATALREATRWRTLQGSRAGSLTRPASRRLRRGQPGEIRRLRGKGYDRVTPVARRPGVARATGSE